MSATIEPFQFNAEAFFMMCEEGVHDPWKESGTRKDDPNRSPFRAHIHSRGLSWNLLQSVKN
jgi:hypothetical protein